MAEIKHQEWRTYSCGDFYDRWDGRQAVLMRPEGIVIVWMCDDLRGDGRQHLDLETIVDGRTHRMWQSRPPSERVTEEGAKRIATRWLRGLTSTDSGETT